jgi:meso-butanediol dehydrogenase/(S,S)-butanediol dehydrogenase/diacetyl reductase
VVQLALPHLAKTRGNIVNVSSVAAIRSTGSMSFYGSVKAALDSWSRSNARPFGLQGVRINVLK